LISSPVGTGAAWCPDLSRRERSPGSSNAKTDTCKAKRAPRLPTGDSGRRIEFSQRDWADLLRERNKSGREELESAFDRSRSRYICPQKQRREHANSTSEAARFATAERTVWRWSFSSSPPNGVALDAGPPSLRRESHSARHYSQIRGARTTCGVERRSRAVASPGDWGRPAPKEPGRPAPLLIKRVPRDSRKVRFTLKPRMGAIRYRPRVRNRLLLEARPQPARWPARSQAFGKEAPRAALAREPSLASLAELCLRVLVVAVSSRLP
jgi:hypothetical protein